MSDPIPAHIRAELDQTPGWWEQQYQALLKARIPRDAASHEDHDIEEPIEFWSGGYAAPPYCVDCGVSIERPPDG